MQQRQTENQERDLRGQLRHAEMRQSQADLAAQRRADELAHLRGEIEKDPGLWSSTRPSWTRRWTPMNWPPQPLLPLGDMVTHLPFVVDLPEGLDADVRNLRGQLAAWDR